MAVPCEVCRKLQPLTEAMYCCGNVKTQQFREALEKRRVKEERLTEVNKRIAYINSIFPYLSIEFDAYSKEKESLEEERAKLNSDLNPF